MIEGGPFSFEQDILIYKQILANDDPKEVVLNDAHIWVQVYDIPNIFYLKTFCRV